MTDMIYLDNAATTFPKPQAVIGETARCMREYCGNPGRGSHALAVKASEKLFECREMIARMFGARSPENVMFTLNTTYALNIALKSFIPKGSHVIISDLEHNAVLRPISEMARQGVITYSVFSTRGKPTQVISSIRSQMRANTSAVVCTLASNICSDVIPYPEIGRFCKSRGIAFIADGAQAAGHTPIDMEKDGIDVLCLPGHKGLYGPQGVGMMLVNGGAGGTTLIEGGSGADSRNPYMPEHFPDRHEAGTQNTPAVAGLLEGLRFVNNVGFKEIRNHEAELWGRLYSKLSGDKRFTVYGDARPSSVMLINKSGVEPSELAGILNDRGICVRSGLHCAPFAHDTVGTGETGGVRVSFGVFNTLREVDALCDALLKA